jgi:hypothetical protein
MVLAILGGRKTQTRRIVKFDGLLDFEQGVDGVWRFRTAGGVTAVRCPHGVPGDRLWVKETWRPFKAFQPWDLEIRYHADGAERTIQDGEFGERDWTMPKAAARGNVTPLFMPRWASRITLEITDVRVERLAAISEADAEAEGIREPSLGDLHVIDHGQPGSVARADAPPLVLWEFLWKHVNGDASWDANPWVWVLEFKRIEADHG